MLSIVRRSLKSHSFIRCMSSVESFKFVDIQKNEEKGFGVLELKRKPVNSLSLEFNQELIQALDSLEKDKKTRGVIITSTLPVFSAGLDLTELYQPKPDHLRDFWHSVQELNLRFYSSPLVMISAINGACPAGGLIFPLSSDYRILADGKHTMGLNEVLLGLAAPWWLAETFKLTVGQRRTEHLLGMGALVNPSKALEIGLVDEVVSKDDLMNVAENEMGKWLKIADVGRVATKNLLRRKYIQEFHDRRDEDLAMFTGGIESKAVQKVLGMYFEALQKKK